MDPSKDPLQPFATDPIPPSLAQPSNAAIDDNEAEERPVREKLKKTSIATMPSCDVTTNSTDPFSKPEGNVNNDDAMADEGLDPRSAQPATNDSAPGRLTKKRSNEDAADADAHSKPRRVKTGGSDGLADENAMADASSTDEASETSETRGARSGEQRFGNASSKSFVMEDAEVNGMKRPGTPPPPLVTTVEKGAEGLTSPKGKRTRDQFVQDSGPGKELGQSVEEGEKDEKPAAEGPTPKRARDSRSASPVAKDDRAKSLESTPAKVFLSYLLTWICY